MTTKTQKIDLLLKQLNKQFGEGTVVRASDAPEMVPRFTTGSLSLDVILGGGWPCNQWNEVIGEESNGKTTLMFQTIAANQRRDPAFSVLWVAAEQFDREFAETNGVDTSKITLFESNIMEDAYSAAIEAAKSRAFDCVIIDSLPALIPSAEDDKNMDESTVGRGAIATNKFFRKVGKETKRSLTSEDPPFLGIVVNQWRSKIGVMYGDPRTTPGGLGKNFAYYSRVECRRSGWIESGTGDSKKKVGIEVRFRTIKNKSAPPERYASVDFYFDKSENHLAGTFDTSKEIFGLGIMYGCIKRSGAYYSYGDLRVLGKDALLQELRSNLTLSKELADEVLSCAKKPSLPFTSEESES